MKRWKTDGRGMERLISSQRAIGFYFVKKRFLKRAGTFEDAKPGMSFPLQNEWQACRNKESFAGSGLWVQSRPAVRCAVSAGKRRSPMRPSLSWQKSQLLWNHGGVKMVDIPYSSEVTRAAFWEECNVGRRWGKG